MAFLSSLFLFLAAAVHAAPPDQPPFQSLTFVKEAVDKSSVPGKDKLLKILDETHKEAAQLPAEKRDEAVERHVSEINALAADAPDGRVNDALSQFNNSAGHYQDGVHFADRALEADAKDRAALINRSAANVGLNRFQDAYDDADRALKLDPDDSGALRARAMAAYKLRHYVQAEEDARRAVTLDPSDRAAFYIMQLSSARVPSIKLDKLQAQMAGDVQREYHGMVSQINQVAERAKEPAQAPAPQNIEVLLRAASGKIKVRDYAGAIQDADRAIAADPENASAYYYRAAANNLAGRFPEAAEDATRALMLDPTDVRARDSRAWAYNSLGRFRDAIADSNHSLEINPANAYAYWNLGYAREHVGDLAGMINALKTAATLSPQFEPAFHDAAARHGLDEGTTPQQPRDAPPSEQARRRSFAVVILSSIVGGLLISAGFIQMYGDSKSPAPKSLSLSLPNLNAAYQLGAPIGSGGMGLVYEAFDRALQRKVAVKVMRPETLLEPQSRERFLEEARTVAALHHPGIVDIHAIVEDKDSLCLVFERIEGRTLADILAERKKLSLSEARSLLKPVCQALDYAHRNGVVHRDLKPANIMVTTAGQVKIMDFGISRQESGTKSTLAPLTPVERASARGTPSYMAPEQEYGEVRKESDVYSLGACLYEMVTGQRPFLTQYAISEKLARRYTKASELAPNLPPSLDALIDHALQPDPHERVRTPGDFLALLERADSVKAKIS